MNARAAFTHVTAEYTRLNRGEMESLIEGLIAILDEIDGDADMEATNDDEPSLGWTTVGRGAIGTDVGNDLEEQCDDEGERDNEDCGIDDLPHDGEDNLS